MSHADHTPTPWRAGFASESERKTEMIVRAEEVDGRPWVAVCRSNFGDIPIEANAAFIVRACNSYSAMLAMLRTLAVAGVDRHGFPMCPTCMAAPHEGHVPGCKLAAAVALATGQEAAK